ncbi:hypothetical protein BS47DRAFT_216154 [Hydnum rufescens UP504]|uniref:Uncharacterized protein n=1 Tax=Hydnum rufescens UP504 TaxID=1448309 RepID=A0A9P6DP34_9AGAM|nr:hypothetical protein BS47DRAFT_216154 [Hydnum rufescens UP504]
MSGTARLTRNNGPKPLARQKLVFLFLDEEILAKPGYKQEFKCVFPAFEVFGISFSIIRLFPAIASALIHAVPWALSPFPTLAFLFFISRHPGMEGPVLWFGVGSSPHYSYCALASVWPSWQLQTPTSALFFFEPICPPLHDRRMCPRGLSDMRIPSDPYPGSPQLIGVQHCELWRRL